MVRVLFSGDVDATLIADEIPCIPLRRLPKWNRDRDRDTAVGYRSHTGLGAQEYRLFYHSLLSGEPLVSSHFLPSPALSASGEVLVLTEGVVFPREFFAASSYPEGAVFQRWRLARVLP